MRWQRFFCPKLIGSKIVWWLTALCVNFNCKAVKDLQEAPVLIEKIIKIGIQFMKLLRSSGVFINNNIWQWWPDRQTKKYSLQVATQHQTHNLKTQNFPPMPRCLPPPLLKKKNTSGCLDMHCMHSLYRIYTETCMKQNYSFHENQESISSQSEQNFLLNSPLLENTEYSRQHFMVSSKSLSSYSMNSWNLYLLTLTILSSKGT